MNRGLPPRPPQDRFWEKVNKDGPVPVGTAAEGNCWDWTGAKIKGYGKFRVSDGVVRPAHVVAWEWENGPVPQGKTLDHTCRRRSCVRPTHTRPTTGGENNQNKDATSSRARSGLRNVHWQGGKRPWRAVVGVKGTLYRGPFRDTAEEAAEDARQLRLRHHTHNDVDRQTDPSGPCESA